MSNPNILLNNDGCEYLLAQLYTYDTLNEPIQPFSPGGGGGVITVVNWGDIKGTLANQTDLHNILTGLQEQIDELDPLVLDDYAKKVDVYLKPEMDLLLADKADLSVIYTKTQIDTLLDGKANVEELNTLATNLQAETQARQAADTTLQTAIDGKLDASVIDDYYTKEEVDDIIESLEPSGTVYKFKGNVANYEALLEIEEKSQGDVYNLLDTGANYAWTGTEWDKLSETIDLSAYVTKTELNTTLEDYSTKQEFQELQDQVDDSISHQDGNIQTILLEMEELAKRIEDLKSLDPEVVVLYDGGETQYNNPIKDFQLSGVITSPAIITSNSVTLKEATTTATYMDLYADQDITIKQSSFIGSVPKATSNAIMRLRANAYITVRDYNFSIEKAYNGIECNLTEAVAKSIVIDGVDFDGPLSNNAINIFGMAEGGVATIANCHFKKVSNVLRLSNRLNTTWTVNLINCVCDEWETGMYGGMILLQDYTSKSQEEAAASEQFKKITINIQNCTKPDGTKITMPEDLSTICGSQDENQILYLYDAYRGVVPYNTQYPTINII